VAGFLWSDHAALQEDQHAAYDHRTTHGKRTAVHESTDGDEDASQVQSALGRTAASPAASTSVRGLESVSPFPPSPPCPLRQRGPAPGAPSSPWPAAEEWQEEVREVPCPTCSGRGYVRCPKCSQWMAGSRKGGGGAGAAVGVAGQDARCVQGSVVIAASLQDLSILLQHGVVEERLSTSQLAGQGGGQAVPALRKAGLQQLQRAVARAQLQCREAVCKSLSRGGPGRAWF